MTRNRSRESPSPPRQACCFGCSAKKESNIKSSSSGVQGSRLDRGRRGSSEEILTDFSTFSLKEQQKNLKKALKEEEKASREAEKVVEWVKQASARIDLSTVDQLLSEEEKSK
ncbi:uncharacterized protein LOC103716667 [Phoenix dactylifera]|uniref:Uncharacterized protein LOC103716667 n=1 Tax=Phoenix dactylifera TaxID=42345 RepID=A0A8B7MWK5_PHODC|nr:uncharacterized protein LOC103716667 [Phoenix dactylifera]